MKSYQKLLAVIVMSGLCLATAMASEGEVSAKKAKKHHAEKTEEKAPCEACEAIKRLEEKVAAQQAEIDQLKGVQPVAPGTTDAAAEAAAAAAKQAADAAAAEAADANAKAAAAQADVNSLKTDVASANTAAQDAQKKVGEMEEPAFIHFKGVKITPGGWAEATQIYRFHNATEDSATQFGAQPVEGNANYNLSELRFSARHSNVNATFEGKVHGLDAKGYVEFDFQGAAPTANETQTNSFQPRLRELWANVDSDSGWSFLGGQTWTLLTSDRSSIAPKHEMRPAVIDATYVVGYHYARGGTFRVTKTLLDKKLAIAFAVENPATVVSSNESAAFLATIQGLSGGANAPGQSGFATGTASAIPGANLAPDVVVKVSYDSPIGHFEAGGIARFFRDRVETSATTGTNNVTESGAFTFNGVIPVIKHKADFVFTTLAGKGIGRFGTTGAPDVTVRPADGALVPVLGAQVLAGFEIHPTPKFDFNIYGGNEYYNRTTYGGPAGFGFGSTSLSLAGCATETGSCGLNNRDTWEVTPQLWYRVFKGKGGTLQYGVEYEYVHREGWRGTLAPGATAQPISINNIFMSSFRYYLP